MKSRFLLGGIGLLFCFMSILNMVEVVVIQTWIFLLCSSFAASLAISEYFEAVIRNKVFKSKFMIYANDAIRLIFLILSPLFAAFIVWITWGTEKDIKNFNDSFALLTLGLVIMVLYYNDTPEKA